MNHTFVVLAYKESEFLEECINSLINQSVKSKIIITSSTPSDFLISIATRFNLTLIINHHPLGTIADDWNFAYTNADTKYVTLAHQDDIYLPNYTEKLINQTVDFLIAFSNYNEIKESEIIKINLNLIIKRFLLFTFYIKPHIKNKFLKKFILSFGSPIPCPSVIYNKDLIGNFEFNSQFKVNLDWDAWIKLSKMDGYFYFVKKSLMIHRIHQGSETSSGIKNNERANEDYKIFKALWGNKIAKILTYFYKLSYKSNM